MNKADLIASEKYNIVSEIEKYATNPSKKAIIFRDQRGKEEDTTYTQLINNANKIGHMFLKYGLKKGDKLLVMLPRAIKTYEVYLAALKLGIIIVPSDEMFRTKDWQYRITHGEI